MSNITDNTEHNVSESIEPTHLESEGYDLEDANYSDEERTLLEAHAKELKLDNIGARKLAEIVTRNKQEQISNHNKLMDSWKTEIQRDKHLGGASFESTVAYAKAGLAKFDADNQLFNLLEQTGYGNNPHVIRFLASIGRSHAEDKVVLGSPSRTEAPRHERLYGKYNNL